MSDNVDFLKSDFGQFLSGGFRAVVNGKMWTADLKIDSSRLLLVPLNSALWSCPITERQTLLRYVLQSKPSLLCALN